MERHKVERGDTLWAIAQRYGVSVADLQRANPGADSLLHPGEQVCLPDGARDVGPSREDGERRAAARSVTANHTSAPLPPTPAAKPATGLGRDVLAKATPSGAGPATVRGERLDQSGVAASEALAERDRARVVALAQRLVTVAESEGIAAPLLAAIASRETECGRLLKPGGYGADGQDFGLMQVNRHAHKLQGTDSPSSLAHIRQAARILRGFVAEMRAKHSTWTEAQVLQGAVAAYNVGPGNVRTLGGMDVGTTHDDYSNDVVARAQYYDRTVPELRVRR